MLCIRDCCRCAESQLQHMQTTRSSGDHEASYATFTASCRRPATRTVRTAIARPWCLKLSMKAWHRSRCHTWANMVFPVPGGPYSSTPPVSLSSWFCCHVASCSGLMILVRCRAAASAVSLSAYINFGPDDKIAQSRPEFLPRNLQSIPVQEHCHLCLLKSDINSIPRQHRSCTQCRRNAPAHV